MSVSCLLVLRENLKARQRKDLVLPLASRRTSDQSPLADKGRPLPLSFVKYTAQPVKWERPGEGAMYPKFMELPLLGGTAIGSLSSGPA